MAMAVVSVGLTTLCLLLLQHMEHKRKGGSMMRVEVWGGAGEYGRSCYFVKNKRQKYYLIVVLIGHIRIVIQK